MFRNHALPLGFGRGEARVLAIGLVLALGGCATHPPKCPAGQERLRTAQLFFGRNLASKADISHAEFRKFVDQELTPRFPDGLTVLDGGGQWKGKENQLIRDSAKVVLIVLPKDRDAQARLDAVRQAYKVRFKQDSVLVLTQPACISL